MATYSPEDVFTPSSPARLSFVERPSVNSKLVNALRTRGKQIVIFGHSGSGKTTLLQNKLYQTYENHITTRCITTTTFDEVVLDAFDQLAPYYKQTHSTNTTNSVSLSLKARYEQIEAAVSSSSTSTESHLYSRALPPQLTPQNLARLMGDVNACWVLEDFHKLQPSEKTKLAQTMKVFMDTAQDYPDLKIVAIGAANTARDVIQYDREMSGRVAEIEVPLMEETEIKEIIQKGETLLNIRIATSAKRDITKYSNGVPSICHQLCLNLCHAANVSTTAALRKSISAEKAEEAAKLYVEGASDTLKARLDRATKTDRKRKYDNCQIILTELTRFSQSGATTSDLLKAIRQRYPDYPSGNLTQYLNALTEEKRGEALRHDTASGRYSFSDPFLRAYALLTIAQPSSSSAAQPRVTNDELIDLLREFVDREVHVRVNKHSSENIN